jgi:hypothetical protein
VPRNSDRWVTPGVVIVGILCLSAIVLGVAALVAYLAARGVDPDPMLRLVAEVATGASALGSFVLTLLNRKTTAKAEANSGVAARRVGQALDALDAVHEAVTTSPYGDAYTRELLRPPVPPAAPRHGAAPAVGE